MSIRLVVLLGSLILCSVMVFIHISKCIYCNKHLRMHNVFLQYQKQCDMNPKVKKVNNCFLVMWYSDLVSIIKKYLY